MHPIRSARENRIDAGGVCKLLGISRRTIQNWENGVRKVPPMWWR